MITMIWCEDSQRGLGCDNRMPWDNKEEMKHFRLTTSGKIVVMGRKTFESIGQALPNRTNIILTRDPNYKANGIEVYHDIKKLINDFRSEDLMIIGGKTIYEEFFKYADELIVSVLDKAYHCTCYMNIAFDDFDLIKTDIKNDFKVKYYRCKTLQI